MTTPRATIRLQFHRGFTFADARSLAGYFAALGVSHIYASPIMTARPGSMHGYDVIDPAHINPELGGEDEFRRLVAELRRRQLGIILDIVPNHMAIGSGNCWWMDVLSRGRESRYAQYFDIDWQPPNPNLRDKVLLPVLGRPYGDALEAGEITVTRDHDDPSRFVMRYFDHVFPIAADESAAAIAHGDFDPSSSRGRDSLHALLQRQHYRLAWWRVANDDINWRRFFDINELAALRIEDDDVFEAVHAKVLRLYAEGLIDGIRVDHIDGLSQPQTYCRKLRDRLSALENERPAQSPSGPAYFVVEKILAHDESLAAQWQTDGTTGYDFMNDVSALLHDETAERPLSNFWHRMSGRPGDFACEELLARRQILERSFSAQRDALVTSLYAMTQSDLRSRDYAREAIRRCLTEILVHFPVYRTYARVGHASSSDDAFVAQAVTDAGKTCLPADRSLVTALGGWLSGTPFGSGLDQLQNVALARFQQLSAPLCAKAVEDTAFYRYGRLISRNDVGFDARQFACSADDFHRKMKQRAATLPHAMLATATHDHKRGEDVRARLAVLSELPHEWTQTVERWIALSEPHRAVVHGERMPSTGDLIILFETVVGAWPLDLAPDNRSALAGYAKRIAAWEQKALREAKLHSDWSEPNEGYERAARDFIAWLFDGPSMLLNDIAAFARRIAPAGAANGLAQTLVKLTAPGVPDVYQGTEYWDLSLVDPDNRSPVDFAVRQKTLAACEMAALTNHWPDGRIKQFVLAKLLAARSKAPHLFSNGAYLPLEVAGPQAKNVVAFARSFEGRAAVVAFCRFTTKLPSAGHPDTLPILHCTKTRIRFPAELWGVFSDALTENRSLQLPSEIEAGQILNGLPIACLVNF
jgi:(1->4)-alpha-D-glucan 1-alpha-D-glucosylmutase